VYTGGYTSDPQLDISDVRLPLTYPYSMSYSTGDTAENTDPGPVPSSAPEVG
jgi:hypothetical protein